MADMTNWTTKYAGIGEARPNHYPVIVSEHNNKGRGVKTWQIGVYTDEDAANRARQRVEQLVATGQEGPRLTDQEIERVKQDIAGL